MVNTATLQDRLGDPVTFYHTHFQDEWWVSVIQSYAFLTLALKGEGLNQHHLIPRRLFEKGPEETKRLLAYVPCVPLTQAEHLKTLHDALNEFLSTHGLWKEKLRYSACEQERAIELVTQFYERHGLQHFAAAIRAFRGKAYD
jgi:hypothetical protein